MVGSPDVPYWNPRLLSPGFDMMASNTPTSMYNLDGVSGADPWAAPTTSTYNINPMSGLDMLPAGAISPEALGMAALSPENFTGLQELKLGNDVGFFKGMIGTKDAPGWGGLALGGANSLLQGYLGMRQYALAKKQLAEGQRQFNLNYAAQRKTTNTALRDRQIARVASGNSAYESVNSYMNKNGI